MRIKWLFCILSALFFLSMIGCGSGRLFPVMGLADTHTAATCNRGDVQAAVNAATDGDTVSIPACAVTDWDGYVRITGKAITIQGAGIGKTNLRLNASGTYNFYVPGRNTKAVTLRDMSFFKTKASTGAGPPLYENGAIRIDGGNGSRITNCKFDDSLYNQAPPNRRAARCISIWNGTTGLIDNNEFIDCWNMIYVIGAGNAAWSADTNLGDGNSIYIEDNVFTYNSMVYGAAVESGKGGVYVVRYNTLNNAHLGQHDYCVNPQGHRRSEIYKNTIIAGTGHSFEGIYVMGGTGVIWGNTMVGFSEPLHFAYQRSCAGLPGFDGCRSYNGRCNGTKPIDGNEDATGYPCHDQPGLGKNQAKEPFYIWNNCSQVYNCTTETGDLVAGCTCGGPTYKISLVPARQYTCSGPSLSDHVKANRDYFNDTVKSGYTPYTYPHPLRGEFPTRIYHHHYEIQLKYKDDSWILRMEKSL